MSIKKGSKVRYVVPDIVGEVVEARVNDDAEFLYVVEYTGADGELHQRPFKADELIEEPEVEPQASGAE
jgi:hypothetical protein